MKKNTLSTSYANIAQRAAATYIHSLADLVITSPAAGYPFPAEAWAAAQRELHAFFQSFYLSLFEQPALFGLPAGADLAIAEDEPNAKDKKQQVKRALDKPKAMIAAGLDFLLLAGVRGSPADQALRVEGLAELLKQCKIGRQFVQGLARAGLTVQTDGGAAELRSAQFPHMLPALHALANGCAAYQNEWMGKFQFSRCDFRALQQAEPDAPELYRVFGEEVCSRLMRLHQYFSQRNYRAVCEVRSVSAWSVKYQGDKKVKATPLFQVDIDDRYAHPLRLQIKCVSTQRIVDLLPRQSQALQDDFMRRANPCNGDTCGWCRNQKTLGPSQMYYNGEWHTLCWYSNPDISQLNEDSIALIQEYEQMHARLTPVV